MNNALENLKNVCWVCATPVSIWDGSAEIFWDLMQLLFIELELQFKICFILFLL